jgi:DNA repair protein RecN (Recombination protein N)
MLNELQITNFAIAENLDIEFHSGLTTITGETGAGKSIMIDALSLALGARADSNSIGPKSEKAQIIASFDIQKNAEAKSWLVDKSLDAEEECILRRVLSKDGKSRAFINGVPSPLQDVKALSELLINIHSQHQHQQLLRKDSHRELLDAFCENQNLVKDVQNSFAEWQTTHKQLKELSTSQSTRLARVEFLQFQLDELDKLALDENEYETLNAEHKKLANVDQDIEQANEALALLNEREDFNISDALHKAQQLFQVLSQKHPALKASTESIDNALIQIEESADDLKHYLDQLDCDPEKLNEIDQRLSKVHQIARKHHIKPEALFSFHQKLQQELDSLQNSDQSLDHLEKLCEEQEDTYFAFAEKLSNKRKNAAKKLDQAISSKFLELGMENARIETSIQSLTLPLNDSNDKKFAKFHGIDDIEMLIATNPGQKPQSLAKIASGGELSRISLAIQVNFAQKSSVPCLIFDEVDVGIGGATAEVVGKLLRELASHGQVICVTHLAQVAAQGNHHFKIKKNSDNNSSATEVFTLQQKDRVEEIARMLGGVELTQKTQSHAKEMLAMAKAS